jgi:hypothetical protein
MMVVAEGIVEKAGYEIGDLRVAWVEVHSG